MTIVVLGENGRYQTNNATKKELDMVQGLVAAGAIKAEQVGIFLES